MVDLGYRLLRVEWGNGYATEASIVSLDFGFSELKLEQIIAEAAVDNPASINIMKKVGMTLWKSGKCADDLSEIYRITSQAWCRREDPEQ